MTKKLPSKRGRRGAWDQMQHALSLQLETSPIETALSLIVFLLSPFVLEQALQVFASQAIGSVSSFSMLPALDRGDLTLTKLFLGDERKNVGIGDIVEYDIGLGVFVTHRLVERRDIMVHEKPQKGFMTKGDGQDWDDSALAAERGYVILSEREITGVLWGTVPWIGYYFLWLREHPWFKTLMNVLRLASFLGA